MNTNLSKDLDRIERAVRDVRTARLGSSLLTVENAIEKLCRATAQQSYSC